VGALLPSAQEYCVRCSAALPAGAKQCPRCGRKGPGVDRPPWPPLSGAAGSTEGPTPPELDPRLHRPSDLRAFTIFAVAVVIIAIVVPVGLYFATHSGGGTSGNGGVTPSPTPIGSVFDMGLSQAVTCTTSLATLNSCVTPGDSLYEIQVESSTITFAEALFQVQNSNGTIFANTGVGSFALVVAEGTAVAYSDLSAHAGLVMPTTWSHYAEGYSGANLLAPTAVTIVVDLGQVAPATGLYIVAVGINGCTGTTAPVSLT